MPSQGRRRFLCCLGGATAAAGLAAALPRWVRRQRGAPAGDRAKQAGDAPPLLTRTSRALGTTVSISVPGRNEPQSMRAIRAAFAELDRIENVMSIYRPDSELSRLNRDRALENPDPCLLEVLRAARDTWERTEGAFDVTIQPLWDLFAEAREAGRLPSDREIQLARGRVDWRRVDLGSDYVRLRGAGTKVTLNGIAQGYAADRAARALRDHGIEQALIDTGELGTLGSAPREHGWRIGIQHPRDEQAYLSVVNLAGRCLATSGDYATSFSPDHRHHHLFDPRTGYSPGEFSSVSIVARSGLEADALSTAVFILGLDAGFKLIRGADGVDAMLVTKEGRTLLTDGFPIA